MSPRLDSSGSRGGGACQALVIYLSIYYSQLTVASQLTTDNPPDFFSLFSRTECTHLEMTDEVNQLKREKRNIREWGREYLHMMWVVVLIASWVWSFHQQKGPPSLLGQRSSTSTEAGSEERATKQETQMFPGENLVQGCGENSPRVPWASPMRVERGGVNQ